MNASEASRCSQPQILTPNSRRNLWVLAKESAPLVGRSYLVVTVPTYIRSDQLEVAQ